MCKFLEKLLSLKETEMVMMLHSYTKWSGISCGNEWTMVSHGQKKEEFLEEQNEMVTSFKDSYKTLLTFFNKDIEMF